MRRWNDPVEPGDGGRVLITRYRPRGVSKAKETWGEWRKELAPSVALHAAVYGKGGQEPISWDDYRARFLDEMNGELPRFCLKALVNRVKAGETITLLCSSACERDDRCHRSILRGLILGRG